MSLRSDAATDRVSYSASPPPAPATAFTVTFWARLRVDRDDFSTMMRLHSSSGGATSVTIPTGSSGTTPVVVSPGNTGGIVGADALAVDQWRMLAVTISGTGATGGRLYTKTIGGPTNVTVGQVSGGATPDGLTLYGRSVGDATEWFNGALAYVRVWSAVLSQAEVEAEWASASVVRSTNLWANWPLTSNLNDISGNGRNLVAGSTALTVESDPPIASTITGVALASFGGLTTTANGTRSTTGSAGSAFSALTGAANGTRKTAGAAALPGGALTGTITGRRSVTGSAETQLGGLTATATSPSLVTGSASSFSTFTARAVGGSPAVSRQGSWEGLLNILVEGAERRSEELQNPPVACLDCGEPLRLGPRGQRYCPFDGTSWAAGNRRVYHA